jgi:hypothetical protein
MLLETARTEDEFSSQYIEAAWLLAMSCHRECGGATVVWQSKSTPQVWREWNRDELAFFVAAT